jgi:hypothetical protein
MTSSNDAKGTMKAVRIHASGGPEELRYEDAPRPAPNPVRFSSGSTPARSIRQTGSSAAVFLGRTFPYRSFWDSIFPA